MAAIWYGTMYLFVSIVPWLVLAFIGVALAHFGGGAQWSLTTYGLNLTTPDELRGRIFATDAAFVTLAMSISLVFAGAVSGIIGPSTTIAIIGGTSFTWGLVFLILTRAIRADAETEVAHNAPTPLVEEL
jgi:uncharacterized oligopeptide transporter (OPT) family protein